jgi:hypothetical protein
MNSKIDALIDRLRRCASATAAFTYRRSRSATSASVVATYVR